MTKFHAPVAVGVPLSTPAVVSVRPGGSGPPAVDTIQKYGAVPPLALNVCEYDAPRVPAGNGDGLLIATGGVMVTANDALVFSPSISITCTMKLEVDPPVVGVPLRTPCRLSVSPLGRAPEICVQVYGSVPPVAMKVKE